MPVSADRERQLLNKYKIPSLYPEKWPTRADDSSDDDDEAPASNGLSPIPYNSKLSVNSRSSYSKYRNIDRHASVRSATRDSESLVRNDEPDALGMAPSVASELKRRGLPIDENLKLRNRFMLSSTTFNPASFLATVHQNASTEDLLRGLDHLSQSIEQKSASLKVLVESNFEKFVKAKATIDNVYTEMRTQGVEAGASEQQKADNRLSLHTRQTSKNQSHFRSASGRIVSGSRKSVVIPEKKKNALTKESEYGVQGIKTPLLEIAIKAEEVWGPTLGGREKEESLREVLSTFDQHRDIFTLSGELAESIRKRDYDGIVYAHKQANRHANFARNMADIAKANGGQLSDEDAQVIIVTAKMWNDVDPQINACKIDALKRLRESHGRRPAAVPEETDKEEHMELIGLLLQLGVDDNPIWQWLNSRFLYLKDKIARSFERSRIELEIMRRKLANSSRTDVQGLAQYLRSVANPDSFRFAKESGRDLDSPPIITFWEKVHSSMTALLSLQSGIVGEVIEYWETTQSFIDNKAQKAFSSAVVAAGQEHLELEPDDVQNLRSGAVELVNLIRDNVLSFFSDPPVDDLSDLYSPIPPTPKSPDVSMALSPNLKKTFTFDIMNAPPPSPQRGDAWEKFAFWAPQSNCISGSLYLGRVLMIIGVGASELSALSVVKQTRGGESLKTLVGTVRERCIQAVCAAWTTDSDRCRILESWTRQSDRRDLTTVAPSIAAFEENVLQHAQKIAYITDAMSARGSAEVIVPPSAKMLQSLRGTFVSSLHKVFSGMVDNAEQGDVSGVGNVDPDGVTVPKSAAADDDRVTIAVDSNNRVRPATANDQIFADRDYYPGHSHAPHALQSLAPQSRNRAAPRLAIRDKLLRQAQRRDQNHPRRPRPTRHPSLPSLHQAHRRLPPANHRHRHLHPILGTSSHCSPHRCKTLHLCRPA